MTIVAIPKYFYQANGFGFMYDTAAEAATALLERPDEISGYIDTMYSLSKQFASWSDFKSMRTALNLTVDVLVEIEKQRRREILKNDQ